MFAEVRRHPIPRRPAKRQAFTLVEMLVVIVIIVVIVSLTLPGLTSMWDQRKLADAETTIEGLLMSARARALGAERTETGVFFYVDGEGVQRMALLERDDPGDVVKQDVFRVSAERDYRLLPPIRAVPRYVVRAESQTEPYNGFSLTELANNDFLTPTPGGQGAQRHRNYFSIIYAADGQLRHRRDVLILDDDENDDGRGDITGLKVGESPGMPEVTQYRTLDDKTESIDPVGNGNNPVEDLVTDSSGVAVNFPSVDGLLIYDDALFNDLGSSPEVNMLKRDFLLREGVPFYINRWTGVVVRGPVGEGQQLP